MNITEKDLAHAICAKEAHWLVDEVGQITVSGSTLADLYFKKHANRMDLMRLTAHCDALRHWVSAAGYNEENEFEYALSGHIMNC